MHSRKRNAKDYLIASIKLVADHFPSSCEEFARIGIRLPRLLDEDSTISPVVVRSLPGLESDFPGCSTRTRPLAFARIGISMVGHNQ